MDSSIDLATLRQCTPHLTHASLGPPSLYLGRHIDRISRFSAAPDRESLHFIIVRPFPLKIAPSYGDLDLRLIHRFLAHPSPQPKRHLDRFSRFCRAHDSENRQQTDRLTADNATPSVTIGHIYVVLRWGLIITKPLSQLGYTVMRQCFKADDESQ